VERGSFGGGLRSRCALILSSDLTLEAVLGGAVAANQPEFHVDYLIYNLQGAASKPAVQRGALNSSTDVTLISPSANGYSTQGFIAEVKGLSIYNKDTSSVTVTIKTTDGTDRIKCKATLATTETLIYDKDGQFYVMTADGAFKNDSISYAEGTYTPTVSASSGTITTASATGAYTKIGRAVLGHATVTITTNGTGAGSVKFTLPFTPGGDFVGVGRDTGVTGELLQVLGASASTSVDTYDYANNYPGADGAVLKCSFHFYV
jgi:hypothetical protein